MHRLIVALLSALDAAIAAAAAIAAVLAPLTVLWVFGLARADWAALWPAAASVWQLGHLVPLPLTLPTAYVVALGIPASAASFTISLAPLAFAAFTAIFAARSGSRAAGASAWITGVVAGAAVFAAIAATVALTARTPVAHPALWQSIVLPAAVYAGGALLGAVVAAWRDGDDGVIDRLHDRVDVWRGDWSAVPGLAVRGTAAALSGLIGLGGLTVAVALFASAGQVIALYESAQVDPLGAALLTIGQLVYLPTLVVWGVSWVAGPGFALGPGTAVSPSGSQVGVVPGIPVLGALPPSVSPWLLLVLLLPVGVGALAGWLVRSRLVASRPRAAWAMLEDEPEHEPVGPRVVLTLVIAVLSGAGAALLATVASGSMGPGRLAAVGPSAGPLAVAVGVEVLVGAGILLLSPRRAEREPPTEVRDDDAPSVAASAGLADEPADEPAPRAGALPPAVPPAGAPGRPVPLPPID